MNSGEGTRETASEVTSPDPLYEESLSHNGQILEGCDASPISSKYSSCGESEFERYCSANSVMGTPSLCSSTGTFHEYMESDYGSVKSFGIGENDALEGFSLVGRFTRKFEDNGGSGSWGSHRDALCNATHDGECEISVEDCEGLMGFEGKLHIDDCTGCSSSGQVFYDGSSDQRISNSTSQQERKLVDAVNDSKESNADIDKEDLGFLLSTVKNVLIQGAGADAAMEDKLFAATHSNSSHFMHDHDQLADCIFDGLLPQRAQGTDAEEGQTCGEEDKASSRYEHSEGEDSMFNYGSDDEHRPGAYYTRNLYDQHAVKAESGSFPLMNTSVALGSKDWLDFELEALENPLGSHTLCEFQEFQQRSSETEIHPPDSNSARPVDYEKLDSQEQENGSSDVSVLNDQASSLDEPLEYPIRSSVTLAGSLQYREEVDETDTSVTRAQFQGDDEAEECLERCSVYDVFAKRDSLIQPAIDVIRPIDDAREKELPCVSANGADGHIDLQVSKGQALQIVERHLSSFADTMPSPAAVPAKDVFEDFPTKDVSEEKKLQFYYDHNINSSSMENESPHDLNLMEGKTVPHKGKSLELNAFYDEVVHEMEEILLDSGDSPLSRLNHGSAMFHSQQSLPVRDGGPTASTSGLNDDYTLIEQSLRIDDIEVVGAKQKKGDISLSERLVGVKEHTVYVIRVWSGKDQWEVERRYRDFYTLYRQLKYLSSKQGWTLPVPWSSVERESRKIFGNATPNVIAERSVLIQECLQSVLQLRNSSCTLSSFVWFLSPPKAILSPLQSNVMVNQSAVAADTENIPPLGKTISLIFELRSHKSVKQLLEEQHYTCAGCHKHFDDGRSRVQELVWTFGWGKPRLCEYTGQLFCSSCHTNDMAVLPARVLQHWDFAEYPVSQLAKSYLDAIVDQPMLCVTAVNPFLLSKVPALLCVVGIRKKLGTMLAYVQCPFRRTIYRGLRSRRYLLESNDFFALRDLIDLSKGAFAALPVILETVLNRIQEHIAEQCLVCCDCGIPCGARQACYDPSSLIFPFQEEDVEKCESCNSVFHKHCFKSLSECPCGAHLKPDDANHSTSRLSLNAVGDAGVSLPLLRKKSDMIISEGLLSRLFSVVRRDKTKGFSESRNFIPMGSFPTTSS
ncbi:hypothetical protein Ancab_039113 [Ancistrocladus abbreviatus]